MNSILFISLGVGAVCGIIGYAIGDLGGKKNGPLGGLLGFLLGPIGILIVAVLPASKEAEKAAPSQGGGSADRIAKLERELERMKKQQGGTTGKPLMPKKPTGGSDNGPSTYSLD